MSVVASLIATLFVAVAGSQTTTVANEWTTMDTQYLLPSARSMAASSTLYNGSALIVSGGQGLGGALNDTYIWQSVSQRWVEVRAKGFYSPRIGLVGGTLTMDGDEVFVVFGGMLVSSLLTMYNETFLLRATGGGRDTLEWVQWDTQQAPSRRAYSAAVSIGNAVYLYGGVDPDGAAVADLWRLTPDRGWELLLVCTNIDECPQGLANAVGVAFGTQFILSGGIGLDVGFVYPLTYSYDTVTNTFSELNTSVAHYSGSYASCGAVIKDQLFIFGGVSNELTNAVYALNLTQAFSATEANPTIWERVQSTGADTPSPLVECVAASLNDQKLTIFGGALQNGESVNSLYQLSNMTPLPVNPPEESATWKKAAGGVVSPEPEPRLMAAVAVNRDRLFVSSGLAVFFITDNSLSDLWTLSLITEESTVVTSNGDDLVDDHQPFEYGAFDSGWSQITMPQNAPSARQAHTLSTINDQTLLLYGGCQGAMTTLDCSIFSGQELLYLLDTLFFTWTLVPQFDNVTASTKASRYGHCTIYSNLDSPGATESDPVTLFVWGGGQTGYSVTQYPTNCVFLDVTPSASSPTIDITSVQPTGPSPSGRTFFVSGFHESTRRLFVFGGSNQNGRHPLNDLWVLSQVNMKAHTVGEWKQIPITESFAQLPRMGASSAVIGDKLLLFGGTDQPQGFSSGFFGGIWNTTLTYNMVTNEWSEVDTYNAAPLVYGSAVARGYNSTEVYVFGGGQIAFATSNVQSLTLGCPSGQYGDVAKTCRTCPPGTYTSEPGASVCSACPGASYSPNAGASSLSGCSACRPGLCHDHGTCSLTSPDSFSCHCESGYLPIDNCERPLTVLIGLSSTALLLVLIASFVIIFRRRSQRYHAQATLYQHLLAQSEFQASELARFWQIDAKELRMDVVVAQGGSGVVWKGVYDEKEVAVKVLHEGLVEMDGSSLEEFEREIRVMQTVRHRNLVTFFGAGRFETHVPFLVTEWMARTLRGLLEDERALALTIRLRLATDLARAVAFLHQRGYVHRDIKSLNCLVSDALSLKLADFGETKLFERLEAGTVARKIPAGTKELEHLSRTTTKGCGSLLWRAPEVHDGEASTAAADCYSLSIVLWEMWSRNADLPFADLAVWDIAEKVNAGVRPCVEAAHWEGSPEVLALLMRLWDAQPESRLTAKEALDALRHIDDDEEN